MQKAYTVETNGSGQFQFGDGVEGWAGMPESGKLMHGFDTSQVSLITTKEAFYSPDQSLSTTLFSSTPHIARRECLVAIERGLVSSSLTVYFWKTAAGGMNKRLAIQCNHCDYTVHGSWTKKSTEHDIECLARFFCGFVVPRADGIDHLPSMPLQH